MDPPATPSRRSPDRWNTFSRNATASIPAMTAATCGGPRSIIPLAAPAGLGRDPGEHDGRAAGDRPGGSPLLHYARRLKVVSWPLERVGGVELVASAVPTSYCPEGA